MSELGRRIFTEFDRSALPKAELFKGMGVASISDCVNRFFCMHHAIKPVLPVPNMQMRGIALTVMTRCCDNLLVQKALEMAQPGDVIVVDAAGDMNQGMLGDIMVALAKKRGVAGYVVDGIVRDVRGMRNVANVPVFARGLTPRGPWFDGPGEINVPISCGGVVVNPGDIIVGDEDGVIVIPPAHAEQVAKEAQAIEDRDPLWLGQIEQHGRKLGMEWLDETISANKFTIHEGCYSRRPQD